MGVFERLPDELKELGMEPAAIAAAVKAKAELEAQIAALKESGQTSSTELETARQELAEVKQKLQDIEASASRQGTAQVKQDQQPQLTDFWENPDKAFAERTQPLLISTMVANAQVARMAAKSTLQSKFIKTAKGTISLLRLWERWESEIDKAIGGVPLAARTNPQTWLNMFDYVKGQHLEELMVDDKNDFVEPVATSVDRRVIDNEGEKPKLSDEETRVAGRFSKFGHGITPEKILETKKKMKFVGE